MEKGTRERELERVKERERERERVTERERDEGFVYRNCL
jgi:hypothetical protein